MTRKPNDPDDPDTGGRTVPPYVDRRKAADPEHNPPSRKRGARTGGASGPTEDDRMKAPEPERTPGGRTGSPAREKPADRTEPTEHTDEGTGPAHYRGTGRGEDQS
jgi:hypothetical protein